MPNESARADGWPGQSPASPNEERLALVAAVARDLSAPWTTAQLLGVVTQRLTRALDADRGSLFLVEGDELWSHYSQGDELTHYHLRMGQGLAGWVAQTRRSVNVKNAYDDPRFDPSWDRQTGYQTRSMLCQPVLDRDDNLVGVVQVLNKRQGYFTLDDERLLTAILSMTAISIVNTRLATQLELKNQQLLVTQRELADRVREIDMLYELEREVARAASVDDAVRAAVERVAFTLHADLLQIAVRSAAGGLVLYRAVGPEPCTVVPLAEARGLLARVFDHATAYNPCAMPPDELARCAADEQLPWVPASGLCVPLERDDGLFGALAVYWQQGHRGCISHDQQRLVELTADQIGHALGQRLARSQAEREDRLTAIGSALAGVLHDFKTPMTVVSMYAQLLKREDDPVERARLAEGVLDQLGRMTEMTRDVLGFARGDKDVLLRKVQVGVFAGELEQTIRSVMEGSQIHAEVHAHYKGFARLDSAKVLRAVQNLARNAREAMAATDGSQRQHFLVSLSAEDSELVVRCSDDGPGVPRDFQHRLFEAFASQGKKDGSGLGLAMVKQVAELHSGAVTYRDTPGGGATFELRLPLEPPGTARITAPQPAKAVRDLVGSA
jgi:signal transduction histidine kinase